MSVLSLVNRAPKIPPTMPSRMAGRKMAMCILRGSVTCGGWLVRVSKQGLGRLVICILGIATLVYLNVIQL